MPDRQPPIYCINLRASTDRRARMERRLAHHHLLGHTRFIEAVPADSPLIDERLAKLPLEADDGHRRAVAAVLASHFKALGTFLEDSPTAAGAIVCEDDILLHDDWPTRLAGVLDNLPPDAPLCALAYLNTWWERTRWAGRRPALQNLCTFSPYETWGTMLYWISADYAAQVLNRWDVSFDHLPPRSTSELIVQWADGYLCYPPLAISDGIDSTVRSIQEVFDYQVAPLRRWPYEDYAACEEGRDDSPLAPSRIARPTTIGLAIIGKNEEASLPDLLASCDGAFDEVVLVDTGSADDTLGRFLAWAETQPSTRCQVDYFPWRDDFAAARQRADDLLSTEWKVWADCDDEITGAARLREVAARAPADQAGYRFGYDYARDAHGNCTCYVKRERLVRRDRGSWVGRLHETQQITGRVTDIDADVALWVHHRERKVKPDGRRTVRPDISVLTAEFERDPDDPRTLFYLAQSYRDAGDRKRAIDLYERRAALGGSPEEVFFSLYQVGTLRAQEGDWIGGTQSLLQAWEFRPSRAEPLYELAWRFRAVGDHRSAYLFARRGLDQPQPDDSLFVQPWVYRWGLLFECSISAYWVGEIAEAEAACQRLLTIAELPDAQRRQTELNLDLVRRAVREGRKPAPPARRRAHQAPITQAGEIQLDVLPAWPARRATLAGGPLGLRMIVRTTEPSGDGRMAPEQAAQLPSADYVVDLSDELELASVAPLAISADPESACTEGHWDNRLVAFDGSWYATALVADGEDRAPALLGIADSSITACTPLAGPEGLAAGDPWFPFVTDGALHFAHFGPRVLVSRYDPVNGVVELLGDGQDGPWSGSVLDGSAGLPVDEGLLFIISSAESAGLGLDASHRFVLLDSALALAAASRPFTLLDETGERCAGLAQSGDRLVVAFAADRAMLALLDLEDALAMLD